MGIVINASFIAHLQLGGGVIYCTSRGSTILLPNTVSTHTLENYPQGLFYTLVLCVGYFSFTACTGHSDSRDSHILTYIDTQHCHWPGRRDQRRPRLLVSPPKDNQFNITGNCGKRIAIVPK